PIRATAVVADQQAGQMAASDFGPAQLTLLHLKGRPQMESRPAASRREGDPSCRYPRPVGKCCTLPGMVTHLCIDCSQTDRAGAWKSGSALAPPAAPIMVGCLPALAYTVEPHLGQKK